MLGAWTSRPQINEARHMKRARLFFWAIGFVLLFANPSFTFGEMGKLQSATAPTTNQIYKGKEVDKKVSIKKKPEPGYTKEARGHGIEGTVILRCVFTSTGQVTNIHVVSELPDGLTERAIEAAKRIKFIPAMKDGHPVSMWMQLEYNFHLR
jgi:TonB family protein